jgi:glycosyltransferase involved in cell wall biosynthesis
MAKLIRLNDNFIFTGYQYQVVPFLVMMDVFVLSSVKEGFPFSILEAMALGIPVVATNVGGIPEVVDDHKTGILVKPGDPESLANVILTLIEDRALREELGKNGGERVKDFSIHSMVKKVDDVYDTLLRGRN